MPALWQIRAVKRCELWYFVCVRCPRRPGSPRCLLSLWIVLQSEPYTLQYTTLWTVRAAHWYALVALVGFPAWVSLLLYHTRSRYPASRYYFYHSWAARRIHPIIVVHVVHGLNASMPACQHGYQRTLSLTVEWMKLMCGI